MLFCGAVHCCIRSQGTKACSHMNGRKGFQRLVDFLLGPAVVNDSADQVRQDGSLCAFKHACVFLCFSVLVLV